MTHNLVDFPRIRRWIWVKFCIHRSVSTTNLISNGFMGLSLILLNPDLVPVVPRPRPLANPQITTLFI
jgi:hypothetical protein